MNAPRRRLLSALALLVAAPLLPMPARAEPNAAERARIDRLIAFVASQKDCEFIRNGTAYSAGNAAEFLRGKFDKMGHGVTNAPQFIDKIATRSSMSGEPYLMRWSDGRTLPTAQVLHSELKRMTR